MVCILRRIRFLLVCCDHQRAFWIDLDGYRNDYYRVEERIQEAMPREVFIVGGGPSLTGFNFHLLDGKDVIAINQSIFRLPSAQWFCTMDYTWRLRLNERGQEENLRHFIAHRAHKIFVVGFAEPRLKIISDQVIEDTEKNLQYELHEFNQVVFYSRYGGISSSWTDFRVGSESGFAGLQLAILLGYTKIYLLGYDFCISPYQTHFHHDYPPRDPVEFKQKLDRYYKPYPGALSELLRRGTEVYSCSPISRLNKHLLYVDPEALIQRS